MKVTVKGETGYVLAFYETETGHTINIATTKKNTSTYTGLTKEEVDKITIIEPKV